MNKLMLMGGAALLAMSGTAWAQSAGSEPAPDAAAASPAPPAAADTPNDNMAPLPDSAAAAPAAGDGAVAQNTPPAADAAPAAPPAAVAQGATEPPAPAAPPAGAVAQSVAPAADASPAPATDVAQAAPAAPGTPPPVNADAAAKVNADWAKYDEGSKGKLTALEFGTWVLASKGQDMTAQVEKTKTSKKANLPAVKVLNATATDFAKADTDKDRMISPNELASYLSA